MKKILRCMCTQITVWDQKKRTISSKKTAENGCSIIAPMNVTLEDLKKCEIRIGTIVIAEPVEGSEKLLRLEVDFGDYKRQILSGIARWYTPEELVGKQMPFIVNLEPRKMMGLESQGMLIATDDEQGAVLLMPNRPVPAGSNIR